MMDTQRWDEQINSIRVNGTIPGHACCYGYCFINKGDIGVTVNQTYLRPRLVPGGSGESYAFVDPERKIFTRREFIIVFDAGGADPYVEIHQYHHVNMPG